MTTVRSTLDSILQPKSLSMQEIVQPILFQLNQVEEKLKSVGQESEGILKESSSYVLCGSGKRFRAALVLFCASIQDSAQNSTDDFSSAIEIATAAELIHSATLIHDDIVDRAILRRLKPTVNVQFGEAVAVLLGDFLYARAFKIIAGVGNQKIVASFSETTEKMCEGELGQLKHRYHTDLSLEEYISFIDKKTASLISSCALSGAILANLSIEKQNWLASFGLNLGIAYQIMDDLLDIVGSENQLGKTLRTDASNGKTTLPLILLLRMVTASEREELLKSLQTSNPDWKIISSLIEKYKIALETKKFAENYFQQANQSIKTFPSPTRESLELLSRFVLNL